MITVVFNADIAQWFFKSSGYDTTGSALRFILARGLLNNQKSPINDKLIATFITTISSLESPGVLALHF